MESAKTPQELLKSFKQCNKVAREKRAQKLGFINAAEYLKHLETLCVGGSSVKTTGKKSSKSEPMVINQSVTETPGKKTTKKTVKPVINVCDVLDSSGSMSGPKHANAIKGINTGIKSLRKDKEPVEYTYTLCDFADDLRFPYVCRTLSSIPEITGATRGSTALFDAIGTTIKHIKQNIKKGEKVLVNIYTDGQENASRNYTKETIAESIKSLSIEGWTFTFIGTPSDVLYVQKYLHIDESNTLEYDGSARGLEESFMQTNSARSAYSKKVAKGEDTSRGFYKEVGKL